MNHNDLENNPIRKQSGYQQLLVLLAVLTVFCVSLLMIRFVNAKSNDKQM